MANRCILHISKLDEFKKWLTKEGWKIEPPGNTYEVLRARKENKSNPLIVYKKSICKRAFNCYG